MNPKRVAECTGQLMAEVDVKDAIDVTDKLDELRKVAGEAIAKEYPHLKPTSSKFQGLKTERAYALLDDFMSKASGDVFRRYTQGGYHYYVGDPHDLVFPFLPLRGPDEVLRLVRARAQGAGGRLAQGAGLSSRGTRMG